MQKFGEFAAAQDAKAPDMQKGDDAEKNDGSTGTCPHGHAQVDVAVSKIRISYLAFNLSAIVVVMVAGIFVFEDTNSLSIMIDALGAEAQAFAVTINIVVEIMKARVKNARTILILDLFGCLVSVGLLLCVAVFGVFDALYRTEKRQQAHLSHLNEMLRFSAVSMSLSFVCLLSLMLMRDKLFPGASGSMRDELNVLSTLLHSAVDFVSSAAIFGTSLWLAHGSFANEPFAVISAHKTVIDASGAFVVCACIAVAIVIFWKDAARTIEEISALDGSEEVADVEGRALAADASDAPAQSNYGTMQSAV